jgi:hypothetical protein
MKVPGLSFGIALHLSWVGLAKADNTHYIAANAEHQHMQAVTDVAFCFKAWLGILFPRILSNYG